MKQALLLAIEGLERAKRDITDWARLSNFVENNAALREDLDRLDDLIDHLTRVHTRSRDHLVLKELVQILNDARADENFNASSCDAGGIIFGDVASKAIEDAERILERNPI